MSQFSFRIDPNYTEEAGQAIAHVQPGLASSDGQSGLGDAIVGTGSTVENSTVTYVQDTNAYEEPMINYAYSQHDSSSVPNVPFHPSHPSVTNVPTQWHSGPPSVFEHHSQPAPGPSSTANGYTYNNYSRAYARTTGGTGLPQEQQHHGLAWVTMPGGFQFAIPVVVATVLMISRQNHCESCGSRSV